MDKRALEDAANEMALPFYYCDATVNAATIEQLGITTLPTFIMFNPKVEVARRMSSDTVKVCQFIRKVGLVQ